MAKHRTGHLFRRGKHFYIRWTVEGKVFSKALRDSAGKAITTKRDAEEARAKVMAPFAVADEAAALESIVGKLEGRKAELARWDEEQNPPMPITRAWSEYLTCSNRPDTGPDTLAIYEGQFGQFTDWMKEKYPDRLALRDVTTEIADEYAGTLNHGRLSANTFNKHIRLLDLVFRVLKKKAKLSENPWEAVQRKQVVMNSRRELTVDELKKVCKAAAGELRILFAVGIYTGLRLKDCTTLRWAEVDLTRGLIRRVPSKTARRNPKPVIVPIHPVLLGMLAEIPAESRGDYVLPGSAATYLEHKRNLIRQIQDHFGACGIKVHQTGTGTEGNRAIVEVGFHSLRHTFVSLCRESNAPLAVVESIVGHSNPAMTRHYTHVGELAAGRAVALLPSVMGEAQAEPKKRDAASMLREAVSLAESITAKNWKAKKARLVALLKAAEDGQATVKEGKSNRQFAPA